MYRVVLHMGRIGVGVNPPLMCVRGNMGLGKHLLEEVVGADLHERYGVSFRTFALRGYHLMSDEEIRRDIAAKGTG